MQNCTCDATTPGEAGANPLGWGTILSVCYNVFSTLVAAGLAWRVSRKKSSEIHTVESKYVKITEPDGTIHEEKSATARITVNKTDTQAAASVGKGNLAGIEGAGSGDASKSKDDHNTMPKTHSLQQAAVAGVMDRVEGVVKAPDKDSMHRAHVKLAKFVSDPAGGAVRDMMQKVLERRPHSESDHNAAGIPEISSVADAAQHLIAAGRRKKAPKEKQESEHPPQAEARSAPYLFSDARAEEEAAHDDGEVIILGSVVEERAD